MPMSIIKDLLRIKVSLFVQLSKSYPKPSVVMKTNLGRTKDKPRIKSTYKGQPPREIAILPIIFFAQLMVITITTPITLGIIFELLLTCDVMVHYNYFC